jgi:CheY-like chemotaxis protein
MLSILLVEDNEIDAEITCQVIRRTGAEFTLQLVRDGNEALDVLLSGTTSRPQLILLDLRLPGIDGWEVLRRLKNDAELCAIPVAVLTGQTDCMQECSQLGGNMYFVKPITQGDVASLLPAIDRYWAVMNKLSGDADARAAG